jgi:hypothetical protein
VGADLLTINLEASPLFKLSVHRVEDLEPDSSRQVTISYRPVTPRRSREERLSFLSESQVRFGELLLLCTLPQENIDIPRSIDLGNILANEEKSFYIPILLKSTIFGEESVVAIRSKGRVLSYPASRLLLQLGNNKVRFSIMPAQPGSFKETIVF